MKFFLHNLINFIRNLNIFCINVDNHEKLLLQIKKGQGISTVIVIPICNSFMAVTLLFFLSVLLNNFRNLVIFCMNLDIDKFLTMEFFLIFCTELLFILTITLAGNVSNKQCYFFFHFQLYCNDLELNYENVTLEPYGILSVSEGVPFNLQHDGTVVFMYSVRHFLKVNHALYHRTYSIIKYTVNVLNF